MCRTRWGSAWTSNAIASTRFVYGGQNQLLAERRPGGWTSHLWLGGELVGVVKADRQLRFVQNDHLGRPEVVTDAVQAVVWRAHNGSWGRTVLADRIGGLNLGFPGQYHDAETGLWYNGFRDYDSTLGRTCSPILLAWRVGSIRMPMSGGIRFRSSIR